MNLLSKFRTVSPRASIPAMSLRSLGRSRGNNSLMCLPIWSSAGAPVSSSAAGFQLVTQLSASIENIASPDDSTIAARRRRSTSRDFRSTKSPSCTASALATSTSARSFGSGRSVKSSKTAITSPSAMIGNARAVVSPSARAAPARGRVSLLDARRSRLASRVGGGASGQRVSRRRARARRSPCENTAAAARLLAAPDTGRLELRRPRSRSQRWPSGQPAWTQTRPSVRSSSRCDRVGARRLARATLHDGALGDGGLVAQPLVLDGELDGRVRAARARLVRLRRRMPRAVHEHRRAARRRPT